MTGYVTFYVYNIIVTRGTIQTEKKGIKMLHVKEDEARALLQKMRQAKQVVGEMIVLLERMIQLHSDEENYNRTVNYNPDDYIERIAKYEAASDTSINSNDSKYNVQGG